MEINSNINPADISIAHRIGRKSRTSVTSSANSAAETLSTRYLVPVKAFVHDGSSTWDLENFFYEHVPATWDWKQKFSRIGQIKGSI